MGCMTPIIVKKHKYLAGELKVPCGKCVDCKKRRVDSWVFRLQQEHKMHAYAHFITLTYQTDTVPISSNGFMTLNRRDFTLFMKRLRKLSGIKGIKYYAVGEYGTKNSRPHYHAIVFGVDDEKFYENAWQVKANNRPGKIPIGTIDVQPASQNGMAYVCKYLDKKKKIPQHSRDDREKEFSVMSQRLGYNYIDPDTVYGRRNIKYHKDHLDKMYLTLRSGHKIAMPRYYRDQIYSDLEKQEQITNIIWKAEQREIEVENKAISQGLDPQVYKDERLINKTKNFDKWTNSQRKL